MDLSRLAGFQSLLIVSCGDVERNPGPPKKGQKGLCKSEVLRQFMRCIQSTLVMLLYKAKCQDPPAQLYKKDPPGWDTLDKDTKFKNVCNIKRDGNQTFDKLVKLCMREKDTVPEDILYVLNCYENLRDSKNDSNETKSWKVALENYVSRNRSMKNKNSIIDHLDKKVLTEVVEKGTEGVKQGNISFSLEEARHICGALDDLKAAVKEIMDQMTEQVKRKNLSDCAYAHAETSQKDEKLKPKRDPIKAKRLKCMVPQGSDSQTSKELGFFMEIAPDSSGGQLNMNNNLRSFNPKIPPPDPELLCLRASCEQTESLQIEPQTEPIEPGQFETQWMQPQHFEQQQMEPQEIDPQDQSQVEPFPLSPPSPYCDGIIESEDIDLQRASTRNIPIVQDTSDMHHTLRIQEDTTDCLSESSFEDEALKSMPLQDVIMKYPY